MRVRVLSDIHLEFWEFDPPKIDADVVLLAGDTAPGLRGLEWAARHFAGSRIVYLLGNHEFYREIAPDYIAVARERGCSLGIDVLSDDAIVIDGVRFLGATLWTDFELRGNAWDSMITASACMADFRRIEIRDQPHGPTRWIRPDDSARWHAASRAWLARQLATPTAPGTRTVVATHHAISRRSLHPTRKSDAMSPAFVSDLEAMVFASNAVLWVHGHTHWSVDYRIGTTRVLANQRGYPREPANFDPTLVVTI